MCGISGCIMKNSAVNKAKFNNMVDIIEHRGPDDRGTYFEEKVALGHRRLAIIDLSEDGHQPFIYHNRYIVVFNGEIYNYLELRESLVQKGYKFYTQTDTEVLGAMYDFYGEACVTMLNGMWAFAIYDKKEKKIFCSRDRFGVKPFYYWVDNEKILFASEIKQIFTMIDSHPIANNQKVLEFLICGNTEGTEETMFHNVKQLLGGHNLQLDIEKFSLKEEKYYDLKQVKKFRGSYKKACVEFEKVFRNSIELRLQADVPVGYCLSGGLDSSSIVCMADNILKSNKCLKEQHSISSCFQDKRYDEQEYIDVVGECTNVISHKVFPQGEALFDEVDKIIWHMDEPFGSTSIYAQWCVFKEAKTNNLKVMLDGQGADEQLAGYGSFFGIYLIYFLRRFRFISFFREANNYARINATHSRKKLFLSRVTKTLKKVITFNNYYKSKMKTKGYNDLPFSQELKEKVYQGRNIDLIKDDKKFIRDNIRYGMSGLLHYEDRDSMAHSIESRVPFLDYRLVELIYAMPLTYKIRNGITKAVLRDALTGILPEKIGRRYTKLGFETPEDQWINNNFDFFRNELEKSCKRLGGLIDIELIMNWFDKQKGQIKRSDFLTWRIICAGRWIEVFDIKIESE